MLGEPAMSSLFSAIQLGGIKGKNRIVMAPMTRCRATEKGTPTKLMAEYYRQRASAGIIISEGIYPSEDGKGYCRTPGLASSAHTKGWSEVVDAVHEEGGTIVAQIMHCGRVCCAKNKLAGTRTVAPSAIAAEAELFTDDGLEPCDVPEALTLDEIPLVIEEYRKATERAFAAGFDGVELHGTSGYLPAQFLSTGTNQRQDAYGGSVENRIRFVDELLQAMGSVAGFDKVGLRICPANPYNDLFDEYPVETFTELLKKIEPLGLAYIHGIISPDQSIDISKMVRRYFSGAFIINQQFSKNSAEQAIDEARADAVSFGQLFIANPDLVNRFKHGYPLVEANTSTIYGTGEKGYTDYPNYKK